MIVFRPNRVDKSNTPIISDREIDQYAREVLADYKPKLLQEPGKINWEHFLESYCGVTLSFYDIYNEDPDRPILGATAFNDEEMLVFDRDAMRVVPKLLERITVVIDNSVMDSDNEGFARFTGLHEGGHTLIHPGVFMKDENQMSLFDIGRLDAMKSKVICCRKENIESFGENIHRGFRTPEEWREHHADYFAAAIAMPLDTFRPFAIRALRNEGIVRSCIVMGKDDDSDYIAQHILPEAIRDVFGVSKKAAFIKLKKCGFVVDRKAYETESSRLSFAYNE